MVIPITPDMITGVVKMSVKEEEKQREIAARSSTRVTDEGLLSVDQLKQLTTEGFLPIRLPPHVKDQYQALFIASSRFFAAHPDMKTNMFPSMARQEQQGYFSIPSDRECISFHHAVYARDPARAPEIERLAKQAWASTAVFLTSILSEISISLQLDPRMWDLMLDRTLEMPASPNDATASALTVSQYEPRASAPSAPVRSRGLLTLCVSRGKGLQVKPQKGGSKLDSLGIPGLGGSSGEPAPGPPPRPHSSGNPYPGPGAAYASSLSVPYTSSYGQPPAYAQQPYQQSMQPPQHPYQTNMQPPPQPTPEPQQKSDPWGLSSLSSSDWGLSGDSDWSSLTGTKSSTSTSSSANNAGSEWGLSGSSGGDYDWLTGQQRERRPDGSLEPSTSLKELDWKTGKAKVKRVEDPYAAGKMVSKIGSDGWADAGEVMVFVGEEVGRLCAGRLKVGEWREGWSERGGQRVVFELATAEMGRGGKVGR